MALWEGPPSEPAPTCVGQFPLPGPDLYGDLDEGQATCGCACGPVEGLDCGDEVEVRVYTAGACAALNPPTLNVPVNTCSAINQGQARFRVTEPTATGTGCAPQDMPSIPEPTWGVHSLACGLANPQATGCADSEVCMPALQDPFSAVCIYRGGDLACPPGYPERRLRFESFTDERACEPCTCGAPEITCNAQVDLTSDAACSFLLTSVTAGMCSDAVMPQGAKAKLDPQGQCTPSESSLTGQVTTSGVVTICCAP